MGPTTAPEALRLPPARPALLSASRHLPLLVELVALALLVILALRLRLENVGHYTGSFDEGVRMEQLLLMEHGYRPYRDIFASQGPLLLDLLYPFYDFFGHSLGGTRAGVGLLSVVGLLGAWWAARALSPTAGLGTAALLALSPGYLDGSRLALAEVPSLAPCLWAVGCGLRWMRGGSAGWLYGAAALGTFGVLIKPMAAPVAVPLTALALLRPSARPGPMLGALLLSLGLAAAVVLVLDVNRVAEVLAGYRLTAQHAAGSAAGQNWSLISRLVAIERPGFPVLAALGAGFGLLYWRRAALALATWPLAQLGLFLLYTDLADKHVVYLLPPLALLAGLAFGAGTLSAERLPRLGWHWSRVAQPSSLALLAGLAIYAAGLPAIWRTDRELLRDGDEKVRRDYAGTQEQAALMAAITRPTDFVLTDHPIAAFEARRLVPPWLVDTSGTRVDAGSLTSEVAIQEATHYQPRVVIVWRRRLGKLEGFTSWLATDYRPIKAYPGSDPANPLQLYVRSELEEPARAFLAGR